jgi:transcriptional regulator with GAF, ATPase, and Fis domain
MAPTEETILLTGASGTGKSFVAEVIHRLSARGERHSA